MESTRVSRETHGSNPPEAPKKAPTKSAARELEKLKTEITPPLSEE
jgi:hypothetical protein